MMCTIVSIVGAAVGSSVGSCGISTTGVGVSSLVGCGAIVASLVGCGVSVRGSVGSTVAVLVGNPGGDVGGMTVVGGPGGVGGSESIWQDNKRVVTNGTKITVKIIDLLFITHSPKRPRSVLIFSKFSLTSLICCSMSSCTSSKRIRSRLAIVN